MTDDEVVDGAATKIAHEYYNVVNVILDELPDMPKTKFMNILADSSALILARTLGMLNAKDRDSIMHEIEKAALEMAQKSGGSLGYMEKYDRLHPEEKNNDG
jgi:hypothetical protein